MAFSNVINISATISSTPDNSLGCFAKLLYVCISVFISFTVFMSSVFYHLRSKIKWHLCLKYCIPDYCLLPNKEGYTRRR